MSLCSLPWPRYPPRLVFLFGGGGKCENGIVADGNRTPLSTSTTTLRITRTMVAGTTTVTLPTTLSSDTTDMAAVSYTSIPASVSSAPAVESVFTAPAG